MKSTLEIRPVYHDAPRRIEGHFVVCFLAFLMERKLEHTLKTGMNGNEDRDVVASPEKIQESLNTLQLAVVETSDGEMYIKTKAHPLASRIFKTLKLNLPKNINTKEGLIECFGFNRVPEPVQLYLL